MARMLFLYGDDSGELHKLESHGDSAFFPHDRIDAWGDSDGTIWLSWGPPKGKVLQLEAHQGPVLSVTFSADGKRLVSGGKDKRVRVWNVENGEGIRTFKGHTKSVLCVAFSPDGERVASGSMDNTVRVWNIKTGKSLRPFKGHTGSVVSIAVSPDGKKLASGSEDKTVRLWNITNRRRTFPPLKGHTDSIVALAFSPDGKKLASASNDRTVCVWDVDSRERFQTYGNYLSPVRSLVFSSDSNTLATRDPMTTIPLWEMSSGKLLGETANIAQVDLWRPRLPQVDHVVLALSPQIIDCADLHKKLFNDLGQAANRTFIILLTQPFVPLDPEHAGQIDALVDEMLRNHFGVIRERRTLWTLGQPEAVGKMSAPLEEYLKRHRPKSGFELIGDVAGKEPEQVLANPREVKIRPLVRFQKSEVMCAYAVKRGTCVWALVSTGDATVALGDIKDLRRISLSLAEWGQETPARSEQADIAEDDAEPKTRKKPTRRREKKKIVVHQKEELLQFGKKQEKMHPDGVTLLKALTSQNDLIRYEQVKDDKGEVFLEIRRNEARRNINKVFSKVGLRKFDYYFKVKHRAGYVRERPLPIDWKP